MGNHISRTDIVKVVLAATNPTPDGDLNLEINTIQIDVYTDEFGNEMVTPESSILMDEAQACCMGLLADSVTEYVDDAGVGAFVCDEYASNDGFGGMIGYVQSESADYWLSKIEKKIRQLASGRKFPYTEVWSEAVFRAGPKLCYRSRQRRDSGNQIVVFHVMLPFNL